MLYYDRITFLEELILMKQMHQKSVVLVYSLSDIFFR